MPICTNCLKPGCDSKECLLNKNLFVYGTLKRGFSNSHFLAHATFLGPAVSVDTNFIMDGIRVNEAEPPQRTAPVKGELYLVPTNRQWIGLDRLEGHPVHYRRKIRTFKTEDGKEHNAWIYMWEPQWRRGFALAFNAEYLNPEGQLEL